MLITGDSTSMFSVDTENAVDIPKGIFLSSVHVSAVEEAAPSTRFDPSWLNLITLEFRYTVVS
jgi:hypothetical protein